MSLLVMARLQCKVLRASQVRHCLEPQAAAMTTTIFGENTTCALHSVEILQTFGRAVLCCFISILPLCLEVLSLNFVGVYLSHFSSRFMAVYNI